MREIALSNGGICLVDDSDCEALSVYRWRAVQRGNTRYAVRNVTAHSFSYMHSEICGTPRGKHTDHVDGNGLNNTRANLRVVTASQNACNMQRKGAGVSRFRGVYWSARDSRWQAMISHLGKRRWLGSFKCELAAAQAYDDAGMARDAAHFTPNHPVVSIAIER